MDWGGYKVRKTLEMGFASCSQSIDRRNNGLAQLESTEKPRKGACPL